jgi:hypothetical protein
VRVVLKPGAELDLLTRQELHAELLEIASGYLRPPERWRFTDGGKTDTNGAVTIPIIRVKQGYVFELTRLVIDVSGKTFGNPYTSSSGYWNLLLNGELVDGDNMSGGLPSIYTESESRAIYVFGGEKLDLSLNAGSGLASTSVMIRGQGVLTPLPPG